MGRKLGGVFCTLILFWVYIISPCAQEQDKPIELSLQDCISLALESNLDIITQRLGPKIQDELILTAKSRFDPSITFGPNISRTEEPSSNPGQTGSSERSSNNQGITLGISDPIATGGRYGISLNSSRADSKPSSQSINPAYRSGLAFSFTQPLLEGFGISTNRSFIIIARNNRDISILRLKSQLIKTISDVERSYWELLFSIENLKAQELALQQARDLLKINEKLKELGKASKSDILQAQAAVASREADVILAKDDIKDAEERLKLVTNMIQDESKWDIPIIPKDDPTIENVSLTLQDSIKTALEKRPEYTQSQTDIDSSHISIKTTKNKGFPSLDLESSFSLNGLGSDTGEPFSQLGKADYKSWYVGMVMRMPLGERASKAELKRIQLEKEQKLLTLKNLEQQIIGDVRGAIRQIETDGKRIEATDAAENFAKQALLAEEEKYKLGLSTSYQLLQLQASLALATRNHLRAVIDYKKSIVSLYQVLGITLDKLNIEFGEQ